MKLCLLAAGFAKRMYPLTQTVAKPLLEVGGQSLMSRLLHQAREIDAIDGAAAIVNARFEADFEAWAATVGPAAPTLVVNDAAYADEARGAVADLSLLLQRAFADGSEDGYLVLAGDNLLRFALAPAAEIFLQKPHSPLLFVRVVPEPVPPGCYSEVVLDAACVVQSFREKPQDPQSNLSAIGAYFLPPDLPELLQAYLDGGGEADAPGHFLAWLTAVRSCRSTRVPAHSWYDIGSLQGLETARQLFSK
jgi:glucose-1-phosphate thymidylyltransferase